MNAFLDDVVVVDGVCGSLEWPSDDVPTGGSFGVFARRRVFSLVLFECFDFLMSIL